MSTIKANALTGATTNSDLTLSGNGTGGVKLNDYFVQTKGSDISSATSLTLGKDGNLFDVTGTTTITTIGTQGIGSIVTLQFDAVLTFTHHSTNLILPGAVNIITAAGDIAVMYEYASADWRCVSYTRASGKLQPSSEVSAESFNLPITLNGTDGSSTHAGDNIVLDASASSTDVGERLLYEGIPETAITALGGAVVGADNTVSAINLKDYGEITNAIGTIGGGTQNIDLTLGNNVSATVSAATTTFQFTHPTASDELCGFTLFLTNGGSQTVNWPGTVDWAGGTAPTLTTSGLDILVFITTDGGTIWHGMVASADSK